MAEEMLTTEPPSPSSMSGTAARVRAWAVATFEVEGLLEKAGRRVQESPRHGPAHVVHHDVEPAEFLVGRRGQRGHGLEVVQVGLDHEDPPPGRFDPAGHLGQLVLGPGRDDDVTPGLGQGQSRARPDPTSGPGDHRHLIRETKTVQNHRRSPCRPPGQPRQ